MTQAGLGPASRGAASVIPRSVAEITPDWLTAVLQAEGTLPTSGRVLSSQAIRIGEEEGFSGGALYCLALSYDQPHSTAPARLVAKLSPRDAGMRQAMQSLNAREARFYQTLSATGGLPVPRCHHATCDPASGASILLLQDLTSARRVPLVAGCGPADTFRVVEAMASLHATWWESPVLTGLGGASILREMPFHALWADYPARLRAILPTVVLPDAFLRLGDRLAEREAEVFARLMETPPLTCLHGDLQIDNVVFAAQGGAEQAILLDWQLCGRGRGPQDLAYFLISSLDPALRRRIEDAALARYHERLVEGGVRGYSLATCREDYLIAVIGKLYITVAATVLFDNAGPAKTRWRAADLTRLLAFCADHGVLDRLDSVW